MEIFQKVHKAYCLRPNGEAVIVDGIHHWADEDKPLGLYVRDYNENLRVIALLTEEEQNILWNLMSKEREDAKRKNEGMGRTRRERWTAQRLHQRGCDWKAEGIQDLLRQLPSGRV